MSLLHRVFPWLILALAYTGSALGDDLPPPAAHSVDFEREVRPIFARACYRCHAGSKLKGGLVLDRKDAALKGGDSGPAILKGQSGESRLIRYVAGIDDDVVMPPVGSGEPLTPAEVGMLRAWIDQGAAWPDSSGREPGQASSHWSFRPPSRPHAPTPRNAAWVRNPIDAFVLARLERDGLDPSPEADRPALLRRLGLDLIGLPPTIEELDAFLADTRPNAYEIQVDRLLASPHYGERWARRWLDRARYADTNGYEKDRERSIWPYRDWVINALNRDMPFDQFTIEQIAGDLLPNATAAQKIATGFHRNTMINEEGGIDVEEFRFAAVVDRVATTGGVWLGLTVQCAQCHTHKFDPITQRDYYRLFAFLNNTDEPDLDIPNPSIEARRAAIEAEACALERSRADEFPTSDPALDWVALRPKRAEATMGTSLAIEPEGLVVASGRAVEADSYRVEFALPPGRYTALRLETPNDPKAPEPGPGRTPHGNFVLGEFRAEIGRLDDKAPLALVPFARATADFEQAGFPASKAIDGDPKTGWAVDDGKGGSRKPHAATFEPKSPIEASAEGGTRLVVTLDQSYGGRHTLGRFRLVAKLAERRLVGPPLTESEARRRYLETRLAAWERSLRTFDWRFAQPVSLASEGHATLELRPDGSVLARGDKPNQDVYDIQLDEQPSGTTGLRLEVLPDPSLPDAGPGRAPLFSVGDFLLSEIEIEIRPRGAKSGPRVAIARATEDYSEPGHPAALAIDGATDTGWTIKGGTGRPHAAVFAFTQPIPARPGDHLHVRLVQKGIHQTTIGRFRLSTTRDTGPVVASGVTADVESFLRVSPASRSSAQTQAVRDAFLATAPELTASNRRIDALLRSMPRNPTTMVMEERRASEARVTRIHKRGEFLQVAEPVEPGVPSVLHPLPSDAPRDRLGLARWLVSADNPLAARVFVNQAWQAFFGRGLVATVDDFGTRGEPPSHPELLEWLATEAPRRGWSPKAIHRLIVTSATYRQASKASPAQLARDPRNELLGRGPRFRVEAETVRDVALSAGGLLNLKVGGPSVYPPQPDGVTALAYGQVAWPTSQGADRYRRGLYTFAKRTAPYATFGLFDAPSSDTACLRRERSNTPLQALTLLNDPVYVEAAQALGDRVIREAAPTDDARLRLAFRLCLARLPDSDEMSLVRDFLDLQRTRAPTPLAPPVVERAAWAAVARALLNLDETITKE